MAGLAPTTYSLGLSNSAVVFNTENACESATLLLELHFQKIKKHDRIRTYDHEVMSLEYCCGLPYGKRFTCSIQLSYAFL